VEGFSADGGDFERERVDVFVVCENARRSFFAQTGGFSVRPGGKTEVVFEAGFDDEGDIGFESKVLEAIIHEEDRVGKVVFGEFCGGDAVVPDDEGEIGEDFPEHGRFITPFGDFE